MAVKTAGARQEFANMVVCVIRDGDSILLKKATRGMSEGGEDGLGFCQGV